MSVQTATIALDRFTSFGDLLKYLRRRAGLTQRELSIAVGYSDAQISRLEQNERLPDLGTITARFLPALHAEEEPEVARRLLDLAAAVRREDAPAAGQPPFKGLYYFDEGDAELFFGRESLTEALVTRLTTGLAAGHRFLAVVGASGSGKSSIIRAGLILALRWNSLSSVWPVFLLTPTAHPLEALAAAVVTPIGAALARQSDTGRPAAQLAAGLASDLAADPRALHTALGRAASEAGSAQALVVVDQFEELFTLCRSEVEQAAFVANLLTAAVEPGGPGIVVIALRADFYAHTARFDALREALAQHQAYIGPMTTDELRRAIEEPGRRGQWKLEAGLADLLLQDVGADERHVPEPGALPLLSHALLETWRRRRGRTMTLAGYTAAGGVGGAIAETAEAVFHDQLDERQRGIARQVFLRLTEFGADATNVDTRRRVSFTELVLRPEDEPRLREVVQTLADARLLTTGQDGVEVAHEALIREWPTLRGWLDENREGLRLHRRLTETAQEWDALGRDAGGLYRGPRLAQALEWAERSQHGVDLNALEREFLHASQALAEREVAERDAARQRELEAARQLAEAQQQRAETQARSARQLRRRAVYLLGALVVAVVAGLAAALFGQQASRAATLAWQNLSTAQAAQATAVGEQSLAQANFTRAEGQRLAAEAINLANTGGSSELAALLALRAVKQQYSPQADAALQAAASLDYPLRVFVPGPQDPGEILYVDYSPDGRYVSTVTNPTPPVLGAVTIWDVQTGQALHTIQQPALGQASFSPDSQSLLVCWARETAAAGGLLEVYNVQSGQRTRQIQVGPSCRSLLSWQDDHTAILGYWDGTIRQIDLTTGRDTVAWSFPDASIAAISQHGRYAIGSVSSDQAVLYDVATGVAIVTTPSTGPGGYDSAAISPDEAYAAFGFGDGSIQVWQTSTAHIVANLHGHVGDVYALDFSPDGKYLLSGGADKTARLWLVANGQQLRRWNSNASDIRAVRFSADGRSFVAGSLDGTARLWSLAAQPEWPVLSGHKGLINGVAFSPDGRQLATGGLDGMVHLWDVHSGRSVKTFPAGGVVGYGLRFTPDGRQLLVADWSGEMALWDLSTATRAWVTGPDTTVHYDDAAFSPDGREFTLAATWGDAPSGTYAVVYDTHTRNEIWRTAIPNGLPEDGFAVDYSPDGGLIALVTDDDSVWLLDAHSGRILRQIYAHGLINGVRFSPDSRTLVTAGTDRLARLWDAATGQEIRQFAGHTDQIWTAAFSPDGQEIATASHDGTIGVWDAATGQLLRRFVSDPLGNEDVAWSPDGTLLASVGDSGVARLWDVDDHVTMAYLCGRLQRDMTDAERAQYNIIDSSPTCGK